MNSSYFGQIAMTTLGVSSPYVMIMLQFIYYVFEQCEILVKFKNLFMTIETVTIDMDVNNSALSNNTPYSILCWYVVEHYADKFVNTTYKTHESFDYMRIIDSPGIVIKFKGANININPASRMVTTSHSVHYFKEIVLQAHSKQIIQEFLFEVRSAFYENRKYELRSHYYQLGKWEPRRVYNNKNIRNLHLSENTYKDIFPVIDEFMKSRAVYKDNGIPFKKGFLFHGVPGCGKTSSVYAIAEYLKFQIYKVSLKESKLTDMFGKIPSKSVVVIEEIDALLAARQESKKIITFPVKVFHLPEYCDLRVVLFNYVRDLVESSMIQMDEDDLLYLERRLYSAEKQIEENDALAIEQLNKLVNQDIDSLMNVKRTTHMVSGTRTVSYDSVVSEEDSKKWLTYSTAEDNEDAKQGLEKLGVLLDIFDGNEYLNECVIIFTSNFPEKIDNALLRPGRIDSKVRFGPADKTLTLKILNHFFSHNYTTDDLRHLPNTFSIPQSKLINAVILPNINSRERALARLI